MSEDVQRKIFKDVPKMYDVIWKVPKKATVMTN